MPDDAGKVLAFRGPPPKPARLAYIVDYGEPCHGMTVSLAQSYGVAGDPLLYVLNGPAIDGEVLMVLDGPNADLTPEQRAIIGKALYACLFHATAPRPA